MPTWNAHVNYRDSKLTPILQLSLPSDAGGAIISCTTPAEVFLDETPHTLQFASRAKQINTVRSLKVLDDKAQLSRMSREPGAPRRQQAEGTDVSVLKGMVGTLRAEKAEQAVKIEFSWNFINPAAVAAAASTDDSVGDTDPNPPLNVSPRTRWTKRSRETGESGVTRAHPVPRLRGILDTVLEQLDEEDKDCHRKCRLSSSTSSSWGSVLRSPSRSSGSRCGRPRTPRAPDSRRGIPHFDQEVEHMVRRLDEATKRCHEEVESRLVKARDAPAALEERELDTLRVIREACRGEVEEHLSQAKGPT